MRTLCEFIERKGNATDVKTMTFSQNKIEQLKPNNGKEPTPNSRQLFTIDVSEKNYPFTDCKKLFELQIKSHS